MRSRVLVSCLMAAGAACSAGAPAAADLREVLDRHVAARGGRAAWEAVRSVRIEGTQYTFSSPNPFTLLRSRPNLYRLEQTMLHRPVVEVFDGTRAWWINGLMGTDWPQPAPQPSSGIIAREAEFDTPLLGYPGNGHNLTLKGQESFEGSPALRIDVQLKGAGTESWYLDPASFLELARVSTTADFGQLMEKRSYFSDFRPEGKLVLPHRIEMEYGTRNEVIEIKTVTLNPELEAARFTQPPPEGMEALAPLAGQWDVTIETRPGPRAPWSGHAATSTITSRQDGGVLEESYTDADQGQSVQVMRLWSFDRFHKVYRIIESDTVAFQLNVMQGVLADGRLTASNEATGTSWKTSEEEFLSRLVVHDIGAAGFQMESERSRDGGKTWVTNTKYTYKRRG
jgi:hypothetical protein